MRSPLAAVLLAALALAGCSQPQASTSGSSLQGVTATAHYANATTPSALVATLQAAGIGNVSTDNASRVWWSAAPHVTEQATLAANGTTLLLSWEATQPPASAPYSADPAAQQAQMRKDAEGEVQARVAAFESATGWTRQGDVEWGPLTAQGSA